MLQCPQCSKALPELSRKCPFCMAELDLLVDYLTHLQGGLEQAESLTRQGELGRAVWAYLAVLEVDPDNSVARRQVGQVATAVRQFDRRAPGRRWLFRMRGEDVEGDSEGALVRWLRMALIVVLIATAFVLGFTWGSNSSEEKDSAASPPPNNAPAAPQTLGGS